MKLRLGVDCRRGSCIKEASPQERTDKRTDAAAVRIQSLEHKASKPRKQNLIRLAPLLQEFVSGCENAC